MIYRKYNSIVLTSDFKIRPGAGFSNSRGRMLQYEIPNGTIDLFRIAHFHSLENSSITFTTSRSISKLLNRMIKKKNRIIRMVSFESLCPGTNKLICFAPVWSSPRYVWNSIRALIDASVCPYEEFTGCGSFAEQMCFEHSWK